MRHDLVDGLAGVCLGALLALGAAAMSSSLPARENRPAAQEPASNSSSASLQGQPGTKKRDRASWMVHERRARQWIGLDQKLASVSFGIDSDKSHAWAGWEPEIETRGRVAWIHLPGGESLPAPLGCASAASLAEAGNLLVGDGQGRLALCSKNSDWGVLALGQVPGSVLDLEPGPHTGTWWVLLATIDAFGESRQGCLGFVRRQTNGPDSELILEWQRSLGPAANTQLAAVQGHRGLWIIQGSSKRARLVGELGSFLGELELPLADPIGALGTESGGLVIAFRGAVVVWDDAGRIRYSRGGFDELDALAPN